MAYIARRQRIGHDPAVHGIFIHGGTNNDSKLGHGEWFVNQVTRYHANRFSLTLPTTAPGGYGEDDLNPVRAKVSAHFAAGDYRARTFQQAVSIAKMLRRQHPELHACPIYACTDFIRDTSYSGRNQIQLIEVGLDAPEIPCSDVRFGPEHELVNT